ncbi:MAPEG family protein [Acanthamoeba castellanii str. Neff]|uniref:MAPEG family protein n=1 Tax=Acanthamoeba castellanii (strain ATCC 30010 / Neff) TaxID=1257118 RepID=L8GGB4_ACACF|nr:MAPEG family protein [Acanthamoeba castellanii str. Neff]ELR11231.1 MAPEG family protein [Acanthamoeba castellanii str. Neff]
MAAVVTPTVVGQSLTLDPDFGWVLVAAVLMAFQLWTEGIPVGRMRGKLFTRAFFKQHFPNLDPNKVPENGYPDMGSGLYASKLPHDDWVRFNNAQRVHYNYLEGIALVLVVELVAGLFFARYAALLGFVYIVGRLIYGLGYRSSGSRGRVLGVLLVDLTLLALLSLALYGSFTFAGGLPGFFRLLGL